MVLSVAPLHVSILQHSLDPVHAEPMLLTLDISCGLDESLPTAGLACRLHRSLVQLRSLNAICIVERPSYLLCSQNRGGLQSRKSLFDRGLGTGCACLGNRLDELCSRRAGIQQAGAIGRSLTPTMAALLAGRCSAHTTSTSQGMQVRQMAPYPGHQGLAGITRWDGMHEAAV